MIYGYRDVAAGIANGRILWRYYFVKGGTFQSEIRKVKPTKGIVGLTSDRKLRFFPIDKYGVPVKKGIDFSWDSRFAETKEEAEADYNYCVDCYIKGCQEAIERMYMDMI